MIAAALVVGGLVLLTVAADRFVLGAAKLSAALHVSPVIVGVAVIGFGTSAPELLVSALAALDGAQDVAFGNLVGSNMANVLLVLGAAAVLAPIKVAVITLRREVPLMLGGVVLLAALTAGGRATTVDGVVLLLAGAVTVAVLVRQAAADRAGALALASEAEELTADPPPSLRGPVALTVLGLLGTVAGARMLVVGAVELAEVLGVSEAVIALTVVAIGTSLPELVTAVAAARRREADLVVGNVLGSNLFNSLPIAGVAAVLGGPELDPAFGVSLAVMVGACALASFFLFTGRRLARPEGAVLLLLFAGAMWLISA